jgi:hypothetical protein
MIHNGYIYGICCYVIHNNNQFFQNYIWYDKLGPILGSTILQELYITRFSLDSFPGCIIIFQVPSLVMRGAQKKSLNKKFVHA